MSSLTPRFSVKRKKKVKSDNFTLYFVFLFFFLFHCLFSYSLFSWQDRKILQLLYSLNEPCFILTDIIFSLFPKSKWKDYVFILWFIYFIERAWRRSEHSITGKAGKASMDRASLLEFLLQSNWQLLSTISSFVLHAENSWRQRYILKNFIFFILRFKN